MASFNQKAIDKSKQERTEKFESKLKRLFRKEPQLAPKGKGSQQVIQSIANFLSSFGSKLIRLNRSARNQLVRNDPMEIVSQKDKAIDLVISNTKKEIEENLQKYAQGRIYLGTLRSNLQAILRRQTIASAIIGVGGVGNLTENVLEAVKRQLEKQLGFLDGFIEDIASRPITNRDKSRALSYANPAYSISQIAARQFNLDQAGVSPAQLREKRVLGAAEHCEDCIELSREEWEPFGTLPPPGQGTVCGMNCRCRMVYDYAQDLPTNEPPPEE